MNQRYHALVACTLEQSAAFLYQCVCDFSRECQFDACRRKYARRRGGYVKPRTDKEKNEFNHGKRRLLRFQDFLLPYFPEIPTTTQPQTP
jgi:hypothetical protein